MSLLRVLGMLLPLCMGAPAPAHYPWEDLERLQARFDGLQTEFGTVMGELGECRDALVKASLVEEIELKRTALKGRAAELVDGMRALKHEYQRRMNEARLMAFSRGLAKGFMTRGVSPREASPVVARLLKYEGDLEAIMRKSAQAQERLDRDDAGFQEALQAVLAQRRRSQRLLRVGFGSAFAIAALAAAFLLGRGRRQPLDTPVGQRALPRQASADAAPAALQGLSKDFTLLRVIGKGGMGIVYEAMDNALHRKVAVKKMREELLESPKEVKRIMGEARMVASLRHPNIVEIYSIVRTQDLIYLVFEFVEGRTLFWHMESCGKLKYPQAAHIVRDIAAALDFAHGKKVVHRDLKPANIMITGQGRVKVMDFGIAYQAKQTIARSTRAEAWGTPPYMAPEQELGQVSKAVDFYALGICFYEMLTGRIPFGGPNFLAQKREEIFIPPSGLAPDLPGGIDAFFKRALAADPSRRFQSGAELSASLPAP